MAHGEMVAHGPFFNSVRKPRLDFTLHLQTHAPAETVYTRFLEFRAYHGQLGSNPNFRTTSDFAVIQAQALTETRFRTDTFRLRDVLGERAPIIVVQHRT